MPRTWLSIRVELVEGGGLDTVWPRPGRIFVAAGSHSVEVLATAIEEALDVARQAVGVSVVRLRGH